MRTVEATDVRLRRLLEGIGVVLAAFLLWLIVAAIAARHAHVSISPASSWARWDSGHYLDIAHRGYVLGRCGDLFPEGPYAASAWCGNAHWFPLYPLLVRGGSGIGFDPATTGQFLSLVFFIGTLAVLWFEFLARFTRRAAYPLMAIAAVFPGSVYYGAVFPVSLALLAALSALALLVRGRPLLAGLSAAVGVASYPSLVVIVLLALVPLWLAPSRGPRMKARLVSAFAFCAPIVISYVAVLVTFAASTGHWDAWFLTQEHYESGEGNPISLYLDRFPVLRNTLFERADAPALQTALVLVLVALAVVCVATRWKSRSLTDVVCLTYTVAFWLGPLFVGGQLSLYRAEAFLVPVVVLYRQLPALLLVAMAAVLSILAAAMDYLFFVYYLI